MTPLRGNIRVDIFYYFKGHNAENKIIGLFSISKSSSNLQVNCSFRRYQRAHNIYPNALIFNLLGFFLNNNVPKGDSNHKFNYRMAIDIIATFQIKYGFAS